MEQVHVRQTVYVGEDEEQRPIAEVSVRVGDDLPPIIEIVMLPEGQPLFRASLEQLAHQLFLTEPDLMRYRPSSPMRKWRRRSCAMNRRLGQRRAED